MNDIALKAENVSKQYRLGTIGTGTLSQDLNRWFAKVRGKEDPFLKIGETNDRTSTGNSDFVWALKDINFEIKKGDVVGIIGRNGAGKSTLLKLLSKTTLPTTGKIKINGRIASLLEVGTGFHPELTGRDNIFLNGAILGMTKREIQSKFDEIVDFAGVARYVDTPVKRYSSGMYVRLAFAVAAHLDPDILIVDEVLAVGDAEFQKKAIGKMKSVSEEGGRTVLFVSHNMAAVKQLCNTGILMSNGTLIMQGGINAILDKYLTLDSKSVLDYYYKEDLNKKAQIIDVKLFNNKDVLTTEFGYTDDLNLLVKLNVRNCVNPRVNIAILDQYGNVIFINRVNLDSGLNEFKGTIKGNTLVPNNYKLSIAIDSPSVELYDIIENGLAFEIIDTGDELGLSGDSENGLIVSPLIWHK